MTRLIGFAMIVLAIGVGCVAERLVYEAACKAGVDWRCYGVKR